MIGPQKLNVSRELTIPILGVACHSWSRTC